MKITEKIREDKKNYNRQNEDQTKIINAHYFSSYKGTFVLKIGSFSACYLFIIWFGRKIKDEELIKHEYGHRLQRKNIGFFKYFFNVFLPSFTAFRLYKKNKLPYNYYSLPWEYEADELGGINRNIAPFEGELRYRDLIKLFFKESKTK